MENKDSRPGTLTVAFLIFIAILIPLLVAAYLVFNLQGPPPGASASTAESGVTVIIPNGVGSNQSINFEPAKITVVVGVNNTIRWVEDDPIPHTVTSTSVPEGASSFDSANMDKGATFSATLTTPGTYQYDCSYHPGWMKGTIIVIAAESRQTSATTEEGKSVSVVLPDGVGSNPNLNFDPVVFTVVVGVNNTIRWISDDPIPHTVTSTSVPSGAEPFDSGTMKQGDTFSVTLTVPGTYEYYCNYHVGWMKGTIIVKSP